MLASASTFRLSVLGLLAPLVAGCAMETPGETADADTGSTHGLITVERSASSNEPARAAAFAAFVRTPPEVDPAIVMRLAGLGLELPPVGQCAEPTRDRGAASLATAGRIEFLNAGDVLIRTTDTAAALAPRAFPAVVESISGVVYTTRDRSAEPLPAGTRYSLGATGGPLGSFQVVADAPAPPADVHVGGVPLAELAALSTRDTIGLDWTPGGASDVIYAELTTSDGSATLRCTLSDTGSGSIAAGVFAGSGAGQLALHRVRTLPFASAAVDAGQVRFDFQTAQAVSFAQ